MLPDPEPVTPEAAPVGSDAAVADEPVPDEPVPDEPVPDEVVIKLDRRKHTIRYHAGDTVLETARRSGLRPPSSCEAGNCATCMAHLDRGTVRMQANNALLDEDLSEGWILTCQSIPTSAEVVVDYDA